MDLLDSMEKEARKRFEDEVEAAEDRYRRVLSAIATLRELKSEPPREEAGQTEPSPNEPAKRKLRRTRFPGDQRTRGQIMDTVRAVFPYLPDDTFDHTHVSEAIKKHCPGKELEPRALREALRRLTDSGEIEMHVRGEGRRATTYKFPDPKEDLNRDFL